MVFQLNTEGSMDKRIENYGRNQKKRKEYIHQSGLLIIMMDVSKAKDDAFVETLEGVRYRNEYVSVNL
jgi:hypothetical protein